jgi:hypothetical protein
MNTAESLPKWNRPGRDLARTPGKCVLNAYLDERSSADALSAGSRGRRGAGAQQERAAAAGLLKRSLARRQLGGNWGPRRRLGLPQSYRDSGSRTNRNSRGWSSSGSAGAGGGRG